MRALFFSSILSLTFSLSAWAQANPDLTCASVGVASCLTPEGMCLEFFESVNSDPEMWENMCLGFEGEFQESPCDQGNVALTCLNTSNPIMPMTRYTADFDLETAQMMCTGMGGNICQ